MTSLSLSQMDKDVRNCLLDEYNLNGSKVESWILKENFITGEPE